MLDTEPRNTGQNIEIVPFEPWHLRAIHAQDPQSPWGAVVEKPEYAEALKASGPAHTAMKGETILCCIGVQEQWEGYGRVWAFMAKNIGHDNLAVNRAVRRFMALCSYRRLEATVDCSFEVGIRWAEMLGFKLEGKMRKFTNTGADHYLYSIVKEDL